MDDILTITKVRAEEEMRAFDQLPPTLRALIADIGVLACDALWVWSRYGEEGAIDIINEVRKRRDQELVPL